MSKLLTVIPARYQSSRFPGKPLAMICDIPMVVRVWQRAKEVFTNDVIVATDSLKIREKCEEYDVPTIMTSKDHLTGTDRIAEVAKKIKADVYINIQGDEPLFPLSLAQEIIENVSNGIDDVINCMSPISDETELNSIDVPKVIVNQNNEAIYLSRSPIPFIRDKTNITFFKQVCIYAFNKDHLDFFSFIERGPLERSESIELLRFIEHGIKVQMIRNDEYSVAVDRPEDISKVEHLIKID